MPERVVELAMDVSAVTTAKLARIERVAVMTKALAINALIEASRAGDAGLGFGVVAKEVSGVADEVRALSEQLAGELAPRVDELGALGESLVQSVRGQRLADLALNAVEIMDRNLYERSCDVRWWATDAAVVEVCDDGHSAELAQRACHRLGVILSSYTVYLDLWVADARGRVVAHGRPDRYPRVLGSDVSTTSWFRGSLAGRSGADYVVDDVATNPALGGAPVATYATAVREGGAEHGRPIGALGIFFDWGPQAQGVLDGLRIPAEDRDRTRAMLLDAEGLVLAASDGRGILTERFPLEHQRGGSGHYKKVDGSVVGYSLTPGYETYAGLGWYGALEQTSRG